MNLANGVSMSSNRMTWEDLEFWTSPEWTSAQEKLDALDKRGVITCPRRELLFHVFDYIDLEDVSVVIVGQDPYPNPIDACGIAFSIPADVLYYPYSLSLIRKEYCRDLHVPFPRTGDLTDWVKKGVLLWNAVPSCETGRPLAHNDWPEWRCLTSELVRVLSAQGAVFVFLGRVSQQYESYMGKERSKSISLAHPASERYGKRSKNIFSGSRVFTRVNDLLVTLGRQPIDWRLDHGKEDESYSAERTRSGLRKVLGGDDNLRTMQSIS